MKELTTEEKAKAYDEAVERAREYHNVDIDNTMDVKARGTMEYLFPELKDSEDEKIRKAIIYGLKHLERELSWDALDDVDILDAYAWLEKQGNKSVNIDSVNIDIESMVSSYEQRLKSQGAIKDSPLVNMCLTAFRHGIENTLEELNLKQGKQSVEPKWCHHKVDLSDCSEEYRKAYYDGWNNCNMQHSQCEAKSNDIVKCLINGMRFYYDGNEEATWGTEKFSMKVKDILSWLEKQCDSKSIWHNEDEEPKRGSLILLIMQSGTPIVAKIIEPNHTFNHGERWAYIDDLLEKQDKQKPAWSEEDKEMIEAIEALCDDKIRFTEFQDIKEYAYKVKDWLKSLKPQSHWKPSEEQMRALHDMNLTGNISYAGQAQALIELYNDLKKLK